MIQPRCRIAVNELSFQDLEGLIKFSKSTDEIIVLAAAALFSWGVVKFLRAKWRRSGQIHAESSENHSCCGHRSDYCLADIEAIASILSAKSIKIRASIYAFVG